VPNGGFPVSVRAEPTCPRCDCALRGPTLWSNAWHCEHHGNVDPLRPSLSPSRSGLLSLLRTTHVPVWLPWPLPPGWLVTGFAGAGDERTGTQGCAVALSGPNPCGGPGEMMLISEGPRVGLGARFAGLDGPDPGERLTAGPPAAAVQYGHRELPLWHVEAPNRAAFAGEVMGTWMWLVLWPDTAGLMMVDPLQVTDLREPGLHLDVPFGAPSPRLPG
jgi:hypothetical protein